MPKQSWDKRKSKRSKLVNTDQIYQVISQQWPIAFNLLFNLDYKSNDS